MKGIKEIIMGLTGMTLGFWRISQSLELGYIRASIIYFLLTIYPLALFIKGIVISIKLSKVQHELRC